jgi:6-phosphogluconolactonase
MLGRTVRIARLGVVTAGMMALTGCGPFFITPTNGGGGTGGGANGNVTYVINTVTNTVSGFTVGTGTLTNAPGMPFQLGYTPQAAVVTIPNTVLYVAGPGSIYAYFINSDGSLSVPAAGAAQVIEFALSLDVTPDGNWLIALDGTTTQLDIYQINQSTGALVLSSTVPFSIANAQVLPKMVKVAPNGALIFASLGTGGDLVFTFNTSTGATVSVLALNPISTQTSDNGLAIDSTSTHLYIARSGSNGGLAEYTIGTNGSSLTPVTGSPFAAGSQPLAVTLDPTNTYAYVANGTDATISAYTVGNGIGVPVAGSPFASGASVRALTLDKTGKYLMAVAFAGAPDLTMYSISATVAGGLTQTATSQTGTDPAGAWAVASTH